MSTQPYEPDVIWPESDTDVDADGGGGGGGDNPNSEDERTRQAAEAAARKAALQEQAKGGKRKREEDPGEGSSNLRRRVSPPVLSAAGAWRAMTFDRERRIRARMFPGFERPEEPVAAAAAEEKQEEEEKEEDDATMADDEGSDVESGPSATGALRARSQARFRIGKHSRGIDRKGKGKAGAVTKGSPGSGRRFEPRRFPIREIGDRHLDCLAGYMYRQTGTRFAVPGRDIPSGVSFFSINSLVKIMLTLRLVSRRR